MLDIVSRETEVDVNEITGRGRSSEIVDARHLTAMTLYKAGMYVSSIAETIGVTPRYVQYIITDFEDRICCNPSLRKSYEIVANKLRNRLETNTLVHYSR